MRHLTITLATTFFFFWTSDSGVLSFTDAEERVPARYHSTMRERAWDSVREATDKRWTVGPNYSDRSDDQSGPRPDADPAE